MAGSAVLYNSGGRLADIEGNMKANARRHVWRGFHTSSMHGCAAFILILVIKSADMDIESMKDIKDMKDMKNMKDMKDMNNMKDMKNMKNMKDMKSNCQTWRFDYPGKCLRRGK